MPKLNTTPWGLHVLKWQSCEKCELCKTRKNVVFGRGQLPADVFFCGEGPGQSEDVLAQSFVGPAGDLLNKWIDRAVSTVKPIKPIRMFFGNLVGCLPVNPSAGKKSHEPTVKQMDACLPRLEELLGMCSPRLIIKVGKLAGTRLSLLKLNCKTIEIIHPSAVLQADISVKELWAQRAAIQITDAFATLVEESQQ